MTAWWPPEGSADELEWARATLGVMVRVARIEGARLYPRSPELRDDLRGWLVERGLDLRRRFDPARLKEGRELEIWLRTLHVLLSRDAKGHFEATVHLGLAREETRRAYAATDSTDRPLVKDGEDVGTTVGERGTPLWDGARRLVQDPAEQVVRLEELCALIEERTGVQVVVSWTEALFVLDALAPEPARGQCQEWGCGRAPRGKGKRLCGPHHYEHLKATGKPCTVPGCTRARVARGLCPNHYEQARRRSR